MAKILDVKRNYKVSGLFLHLVFELAKICSSSEHKNIMLKNGKRYFTPDGTLIKEENKDNEIVIEEVNGLKDITIGKLIAEFEKMEWESL